MKKCWEVIRCGRHPGDGRAKENGVCPVPGLEEAVCWLVAGPHAPPEQQCIEVQRGNECNGCNYYNYFHSQLGEFMNAAEIGVVKRSWVHLLE
ncbi:MAG: hypothetical protein G8237_14635 [Magnetococcales bacterium]|nr:hypothetical protein [Magnetococcales bacterium]